MKAVKYFQHPTYTEALWASRNPYLKKGEIGFVLEGIYVVAMKVGPGRWNDLPYTNDSLYRYLDVVTNEIGDAEGVLAGKKNSEILHLMLNPYQVPVISNAQNNASGSGIAQNESIVEIGQIISGPISVAYDISYPLNLQGSDPIQVSAGGIFSNEGNLPNNGILSLTLVSPLNPTVPTTYTIALRPIHQQGNGAIVTTTIKAYPKLIWGVSPNPNLDAVGIMNMAQKKTVVSNQYKRDYDFTAVGYPYIAIPGMLGPSNVKFADISNPEAPAHYSFEDRGTLMINNGVGTYTYQIFRGTFYINVNSVARLS